MIRKALAKVSNGHPPQPLPSREGLIYQPSPLVGEGKGEGVNGLLQDHLLTNSMKKIPKFRTGEEAARFWEKHSIADYWDDLEDSKDIFKKPKLTPVTLKFDPLVLLHSSR